MAKKEDDKSLETDDMDDLDNLDLPELDLGMDPGDDSRTPVRKLSAGFSQGVKDDLVDQRKVPERLKRMLPESYSSSLELGDYAAGTLGDLYNTVRKETRTGVRDFKKMTRGIIDEHESKIPEVFREKLKAITATEEERQGQSQEQLRDAQVAESMSAIFEAQTQAQDESRQRESEEQTVRDVLESHRHEGEMELLRGMRSDVARQVSYQDQVAARWQRKSLELQYRQLFIGRDLLKVTEEGVLSSKEALKNIVKNTSLPEYRKIELGEAGREKLRDRLLGDAGNQIKPFWDELKGNVLNLVGEKSRNLSDSLSLVASLREQSSGMVDGATMAGSMVGGGITSKVLGKVLGKVRTSAEARDDVMRAGNNAERLVRDLPSITQEAVSSGELLDSRIPYSYEINNILREIVPTAHRSNIIADVNKVEDSFSPAIFDQITRRSIVEIIPGFLSRIHHEIEGMRGDGAGTDGGGPGTPGSGGGPSRLTYDLHTGEFVREEDAQNSLKNAIIKERDGQNTRDRLTILMDLIDPEGTLSIDERLALGSQLLDTASDPNARFNPLDMVKGDWANTVPEGQREGLEDFIRERFEILKETDEDGDIVETIGKSTDVAHLRNVISKEFTNLKREMPDPKDQIEAYVQLGLKEQLQNLGIIQTDAQGDTVFDRDEYLTSLQNGGWGVTLTDAQRQEMVEEDTLRREEILREKAREEEVKAAAKKYAKERYEKSLVGRTVNRFKKDAKEKTRPATDYLREKADKASTEFKSRSKPAREYLAQQTKDIKKAIQGDNAKEDLKAIFDEQSTHLKDLVTKEGGGVDQAKDYLKRQTDKVLDLANNGDITLEQANEFVRTQEEKLTKLLEDRGITRDSLTQMKKTVQGNVSKQIDRLPIHGTDVEEEERVTELPYAITRSPYSTNQAPEDLGLTTFLKEQGLGDYELTQPDAKKGLFDKVSEVIKRRVGPVEREQQLTEVKDKIQEINTYLTEQVSELTSGTGEKGTYKTIRQHTERFRDQAQRRLTQLKKDVADVKLRSVRERSDEAAAQEYVRRIRTLDDDIHVSDRRGPSVDGVGDARFDYHDSDDRTAFTDHDRQFSGEGLTRLIQETLAEGQATQRDILTSVQDIQSLLEDPANQITDTDRLIEAVERTVDPEHRDNQLLLLTRILETLEASAQAKAEDDTDSQSFLGKVFSKTRSLVGVTGRGLGRYYQGVFGGMGSIARGMGGLVGGVASGVGGLTSRLLGGRRKTQRREDVYVKGRLEPALYATKMGEGVYYDAVSNKTIQYVEDLKRLEGSVMELSPQSDTPIIVLSLEDVRTGLVDAQGRPLFGGGSLLGGVLKGSVGLLGGYYRTVLGAPGRVVAAVSGRLTGAIRERVNRPVDVYVRGEEHPRMLAAIMRRGGYIDAVSGRVVDHHDKIRGPVHDIEGMEVLSTYDIQQGLVDVRGARLDVSSRLMQKVGNLLRKPFDLAKWGMEKGGDILRWGGGVLGDMFSGFKGMFQKGISKETGDRQLETLEKIRDILDERLEKPNRWDTDGDGYRQGSWRERFANKKEEDAQAAAAKEKGPTKGLLGKVSSLLGGVGGVIGGAIGLGKGKGDTTGSDADGGLVDTALDTAADIGMWEMARRAAARIFTRGGTQAATGAAGAMAAKGGLGATIAAGLPAAIAIGAVAGVGYLAYREFSKDRTFGSLTKLRMLQYGFASDDSDNLAKVKYIEEILRPHVSLEGGMADINWDKVDLEDLAINVGIDVSNERQVTFFSQWLMARFYPVFLTHIGAVKVVDEIYTLKDIDLKFDRAEKAQYIPLIRAVPNVEDHPYSYRRHPFASTGWLYGTAERIRDAFDSIAETIKEEEDKESRIRATSATGADLSARNLKNIGNQSKDALDDPDVTQATVDQGLKPTIMKIGESRPNYITVKGNFINFKSYDLSTVKAFDAVRFKAYGLTELDDKRVENLKDLEQFMLDEITFEDSYATFDGDPKEVGEAFYSTFGLGFLQFSKRNDWIKWFRHRFLNIFLNYATALKRIDNDYDTAKEKLGKDADKALELANTLAGLTVEIDEGVFYSVWGLKSCPWRNIAINADRSTVDDNLEILRQNVENRPLKEERSTVNDAVVDEEPTVEETRPPEDEELGSSVISRRINADMVARTSRANSAAGAAASTGTAGSSSSSGGGSGKRAKIPAGEGMERVMAIMVEMGINDPMEQAMMLAQMMHESANFTTVEENLNYRTSQILKNSRTARRRGEAAAAKAAAEGPESVAAIMYGNRPDLGNTQPGDGWKYRGRGFIQITGRDNYTRLSKATGYDYVNNPDLLFEPEHAARASIYWWKNRRGLSAAAKRGDIKEATRLVNGGDNGYADRIGHYNSFVDMARSGELTERIHAAVDGYEKTTEEPTAVAATSATYPSSNEESKQEEQQKQASTGKAGGLSLVSSAHASAGQLPAGSGRMSDQPSITDEGNTALDGLDVEAPVRPPEAKDSVTGTNVASWDPADDQSASAVRRSAANLTYVGGSVQPPSGTQSEHDSIDRRRRIERQAQEKDVLTRIDQNNAAVSLSELVGLTRKGVQHQANMDRNLASLLSVTQQQMAEGKVEQPVEQLRPDTTQQDLTVAARRQGRNNSSVMSNGAVSVARKNYR